MIWRIISGIRGANVPERASKEPPEAAGSRRVGAETLRSGLKPSSLRAQFRLTPIFMFQGLVALIGLLVFIVFIANALLLQSGTRSGTILDGLDFALLRQQSASPGPSPSRGNTIPHKEGAVAVPLPRKRFNESEDPAPDQIAMLLTNTDVQNMSPRVIIYVQQMLNRLGYGPLSENGSYSPQVRTAIARFEKERKMLPTGEIDGALVRELGRESGTPLE